MAISSVEMNSLLSGSSIAMGTPRQETAKPAHDSAETAFIEERLRAITAEMQSQIERMNVSLEFTAYGRQGDKFAVIVANKETGEVIREIPSRELQELYTKMDELSGILFNRQA